MFEVKKVNDFKVKPIPIQKIDPNKIKGYSIIPELYANVYMVAHKKSGKTTCIFNILKECTNKDTKLVSGSTIHNDAGYKYIFKYFKKKGNPILKFTSIIEEKNDRLKGLLDSLKMKDVDSDEEKEEPIKYIEVNDSDDEKPKKPKKVAPEIIFIFDDLSKAMRTPSYSLLIKTNRHYLSKTITSSQNLKDIQPEARENIDILILFKEIKGELLKTIYEDFNIKLDFARFLDLYYDATKEKHSFLCINTREHEYRKNFNMEYTISALEK